MVADMMETSCPFCRIVSDPGQYPWIVYEGPSTVAFFPDSPATLGHTLVIPRVHARYLWEIDRQTAHEVMDTTRSVARAINQAMDPDGINIIQSNGEMAEQSVHHVHVHVLPRFHGDAVEPIWPDDQSISAVDKKWAHEAIAVIVHGRGRLSGE